MSTIKINRRQIRQLKDTAMESSTHEKINLESACQRLRLAMADLEEIFVNRTEEIAALTLAIATGQHLLMEGLPGVAKSDLAREAFSRITGVQVYDKMFNKGTSPDDVFGPTLIEKYKSGVWEHNTEGALPTAHFANLEELGRASDVLLPSMMTVLNERLFHNGNKVTPCPLITAVATTNFMADTDELAAFNDRWLIRMIVKPLDNVHQRSEMILRSTKPRPVAKKFVSLAEIRAINHAVRNIAPDDDVIALYTELAQQYGKAANSGYVSDRRLVATFRLARARAVMENREKVTPDDLEVVRYGLSQVGGKVDETVFTTVLQRVVGDIAALREETTRAKTLSKWAVNLQNRYDPSMPRGEAAEIYAECCKVIDSFRAYQKPIKSPENSARFNEAVSRLESLRDELKDVLGEFSTPV